MKKVSLLLFALFVITSKGVFSQELTCPASPEQLAANIKKQERQNAIAHSLGWTWIRNDADLHARVLHGELATVPRSGDGYRLRRGVRPYLNQSSFALLIDIGKLFSKEHEGRKLEVSSTVRTLPQHVRLQGRNPNGASCVTPLRCSTHLYSAIDFPCRYGCAWLRRELEEREARNEVVFIEEKCRPHFHVFAIPPEMEMFAERHSQTPAEEDEMSPGTQPVAVRDGGGR